MRAIINLKNSKSFNIFRYFVSDTNFLSDQRLQQAYLILDLEDTANIDEVKERYAKLVYRFHPDTGSENADPNRLEKVRNAYKFIIKNTESIVEEEEKEKDFGINHVAPQHRQYLEHGGRGSGNPFARQQQYQQFRVLNALENVREFTVEKSIRETQDQKNTDLIAIKDQKRRRGNQLTGMLDRVVEDMILAGMATGEFNNLKGSGKPLKMDETNPYIDQTQQRINRILRDNGFSPPWIIKEKDLRTQLEDFRNKLRNELAFEIALLLNSDSIDESNFLEHFNGEKILNLLANKMFIEKEIIEINRLIQNYNLIAPSMDRQFQKTVN